MADHRPAPPRRPAARSGSTRARTGPGRVPGPARGARPPAPPAPSTGVAPRRPRLTGRAAILVLVLAVLAVSYASSLRAYLQQREHIGELKSQIAERQSGIAALEREKRRWEDPAYVKVQARERFGYVMRGETSYVVLDEDGRPLQSESSLLDPDEVLRQAPVAWWDEAWASVELAGNPPAPQPPPLTDIDGSPSDDAGAGEPRQ